MTNHPKFTASHDPAARSVGSKIATGSRCECESVSLRDALTLLVEFIEPVEGGSDFEPKRDMEHLKILVQHAKKALSGEPDTLTRLVKRAHGSVIGNRGRMRKEFTNCKGILATSAWGDAITQMTDWIDEVEHLFPELKMENRLSGNARD